MKLTGTSIRQPAIQQYRFPTATLFRIFPSCGLLLLMEVFILFIAIVMPLRGLCLYNAFPSTHIGSWLLTPTRVFFPHASVVSPVHRPVRCPVPLSIAWKQTGMLFLSLLALFVVYLLAIRWLPRHITHKYIFLTTALLGFTCVFYAASSSQDIFSYIAYARIGDVYHLNPLTTLPVAIRHDIVYPYINWIYEPSAYGPTWIAITCTLQGFLLLLGMKSLLPMVLLLRLFGLAMHLISVMLVWWLGGVLQRMTNNFSHEKRLMSTLAFAWNPLLLIESCVNAHNDTTILLLVLLAICCLVPRSDGKQPLYLLAAALLALAVCLKVTLVVLFPGLLLFLWEQHSHSWRTIISTLIVYLGTIAALYAPFWQHSVILYVFHINPGVSRVANSPYEFVWYAYESLRDRAIVSATAEVGTPFEIWMHRMGDFLFITAYIVLSIRALLVQRIDTLPALIRWFAIAWFLYCFVGSPWLWPWYFTTFFGLFALIEATGDYPRALSSILDLPLASCLFAFALLNIYTFDTWATHASHIPGLLHFPWAFTRGLWLCVLPLLALHPSAIPRLLPLKYLVNICIVLVMCGLLYFGASWEIFNPYRDVAKYQCYAVAFWKGENAVRAFPAHQCSFIFHPSNTVTNKEIAQKMQQVHLPQPLVQYVASRSRLYRFHALPYEYPLLAIMPFSLGLLVPFSWYQVAFAFWMALIVVLIYVLLARYRSWRSAVACAIYLVSGCLATALWRFDLVPSALTLSALLCAVKRRWNWAFVFLALGTLLKFYPAILVLPFLLAQQLESREPWNAWRRWLPLGTFIALCILVMGVSFVLSAQGTLSPLSYFGNRPVQAESFPASLMWLTSLATRHPLTYALTYGSLNVFGPLGSKVGILGTVLEAAGLLYTYWLQWCRKIDLATSSLLTLLIVIVTGKVFSPQYLIWVAPLVAYVGEANYRWLISWTILGALTTWIYPYIYTMAPALEQVPFLPLYFPVIALRNFLLLGFVLALLIYCARRKPATPAVGNLPSAPTSGMPALSS